MKSETVRKRTTAMANRWERDLAALDRMFPRMNLTEELSNAAEIVRNLATAVSYADAFGAMSDDGIQKELSFHRKRKATMGNHDVGRAIGAAARAFWAGNGDAPVTKERALAVLDAAAEQFRGADAEFDDECWEGEPLGRLLAIAFGPWPPEGHEAGKDDDGEGWYEGIELPFLDRYDFT